MATRLHRLKGTQFFDDDGLPLNGGKLTYHEAGTTNLQTTYSEADGDISHVNANPLTLDSAGRLTVSVYFGDSSSFSDYKETLTNAALVTISNWPIDDLPAAEPTATAAAFSPPLFPWTQVTNAASPVALTAADAGKAYEADTTAGSIEFDLPSAAAVGDGKGFVFKKTIAANSMIIDPSGSETIDNVSASLNIANALESLGIYSNGAEWYTIFSHFNEAIAVQAFTGSGTYTPHARMRQCLVISTGAGGGGGGADSTDGSSGTAGGGGGAGGTCIELFTAADIGASRAVEIGAGGTAGSVAGGNGGTGGNTNFGTGGALHFAVGGSGGEGSVTAVNDAQSGGTGGSASGGLVNITGGGGASAIGDIFGAISGAGGASFWGGGGAGVGQLAAGTVAGNAGAAFGSGASGGANVNDSNGIAGGVGAAGFCVVIEFLG